MTRRATRRNSLEWRPPEVLHPTRSGQFLGVYASTSRLIAESYAQNAAWNRDDPKSWPVILTLDTVGLDEQLDPSAAHWLSGKTSEIEYLAEDLVKLGYLDAVAERWASDDVDDRSSPGTVWGLVHRQEGEESFMSLPHAIGAAASRHGLDAEELARQIAREKSVPTIVANAAVQQHRYVRDIEERRILAVDAVRPWWNPLLSGGGDDEDGERAAKIIERAGYQVFTEADYNIGPSTDFGHTKHVVSLFKSHRRARREEYHGTVADLAKRVFKKKIVGWPSVPPFPVTPQSEVWDTIATEDLEGAFQ